MCTESMEPERDSGVAVSAPGRTMRRWLAPVATLAAVLFALMASGAAAAPKPIVFSGTLDGLSVDVDRAMTGDTFHTTNGAFTAVGGLKSGVYSSSFTLGGVSFPIPVIVQFEVTGTFTLKTNGGTFTAAVIPASSSVTHATIPGDSLNRRFNLDLQVVEGTGRFKKMTGTLRIEGTASACGWPPGSPLDPLCPDVPFGSDPILDWFMRGGTVSGTLVRTTGPPSR